MIRADIYRDNNKKIYGYFVKGHANYDEYGRDIVCAAVSILTQNTLFSLLKLFDFEKNNINYKINDDGFLEVKIRDKEVYCDEKVQILLESLVLGLNSVEDSYPKYITLND